MTDGCDGGMVRGRDHTLRWMTGNPMAGDGWMDGRTDGSTVAVKGCVTLGCQEGQVRQLKSSAQAEFLEEETSGSKRTSCCKTSSPYLRACEQSRLIV